MRTEMISCVICALMINIVILIAMPINTTASSMTIEYQIGTRHWPEGEIWSPWMSDGQVANVTSNVAPTYFLAKIRALGYHVEYQIGIRHWPEGEIWSPWMSDGQVANVTSNVAPTFFKIKIKAPGCHVEYQIGTRDISGLGQVWSPWVSDGQVANVTSHIAPTSIHLSVIMTVPITTIVDIDPDTLNLKSKGRWITCYITLNNPYNVNDIDISTILLENTIPAEWGDIQNDTLMVKFDRSAVEDMLSPGTYNLKVTGELTDRTKFEGYNDEIRVIDPP